MSMRIIAFLDCVEKFHAFQMKHYNPGKVLRAIQKDLLKIPVDRREEVWKEISKAMETPHADDRTRKLLYVYWRLRRIIDIPSAVGTVTKLRKIVITQRNGGNQRVNRKKKGGRRTRRKLD